MMGNDGKDTRNIHQRLLDVMSECSYVQKDRNKGMQYATTSHDKVTAKVRPYLIKHGIRYDSTVIDHGQDGNRSWVRMSTRFINCYDPDDQFAVETFGYGIDSQDKGPGKAMSYAVKYALLKTLGLETGEDADNESIEYEAAKPEPVERTVEHDEPAPPDNMTGKLKAKLVQIARQNGASLDMMRDWILTGFGKSFDDMTPGEQAQCVATAQREFSVQKAQVS